MILIKPSATIEFWPENPLKQIEIAGRTCYKSEDRITDESAAVFAKMLVDRGHHAMIEHVSASVRITCDRGVSHELVRHRVASYAQESQRYCRYSGNKFGNQIRYIIPPWIDVQEGEYHLSGIGNSEFEWMVNGEEKVFFSKPVVAWLIAMSDAENSYMYLLDECGQRPEQARSVLNNSTKTEVVMTANFREWRHVFGLRCSDAAHPQMREIMIPLREEFARRCPEAFGHMEAK